MSVLSMSWESLDGELVTVVTSLTNIVGRVSGGRGDVLFLSLFLLRSALRKREVCRLGRDSRRERSCSVPSPWRPHIEDKRMVLEYTHGLFIT